MSGYAIQYVPLSGLGQPINAELRQVRPGAREFYVVTRGKMNQHI